MVGQRLVMARHSSHRATTNLDGASNLAPKLRLNIQFGSRRGCHEPNDKNAPIQPFRIQTWNGRDQRTSIFQRCNRGNTAQQPSHPNLCLRLPTNRDKTWEIFDSMHAGRGVGLNSVTFDLVEDRSGSLLSSGTSILRSGGKEPICHLYLQWEWVGEIGI